MTFRRLKNGVFALEALNGLATSLYFNYLFFYLREHYGLSSQGNLLFGAANGFIYMFAAFFCGRFAQKHGYFVSLRIGFAIVIAAVFGASLANRVWIQFVFMALWTIGICFTWPVLEALTSEHESSETLPGKIGCYNIVWSAAQAIAYFSGGALVEALGWKSIFYLPVALHAIQFGLTHYLAKARDIGSLRGAPVEVREVQHEADAVVNQRFLRMAWLANPFAYIAMNTVIPLIPDVAARLHLSPKFAGFFCSIWMFARVISFAAFWKWTGWHYRFRWLLTAYLLLIVSFTCMLLLTNLAALIAVQITLGWATGLIYYSSLFYSMDASDTKGAHGGIHEAAIGAGIFGGPAIGFSAVYLMPAVTNVSVFAVSGALLLGLGGLLLLRRS